MHSRQAGTDYLWVLISEWNIAENAEYQGLLHPRADFGCPGGLKAFVDAEIFVEAVSEIKAGKNRAMDSAFAQRLKPYFEPSALT